MYFSAVSAWLTGSWLGMYSISAAGSRRHTALSANHTFSITASALRASGFAVQGIIMGKVEWGRPFSARAR